MSPPPFAQKNNGSPHLITGARAKTYGSITSLRMGFIGGVGGAGEEDEEVEAQLLSSRLGLLRSGLRILAKGILLQRLRRPKGINNNLLRLRTREVREGPLSPPEPSLHLGRPKIPGVFRPGEQQLDQSIPTLS